MNKKPAHINEAIAISRNKVEEFILSKFPNAVAYTMWRETDHGGWFNAWPKIYDINSDLVSPPSYSDAEQEWEEDFIEAVGEDYYFWLDNSLDDDDTHPTFVIQKYDQNFQLIDKSPPEPPKPPRITYGPYQKELEVGMTIQTAIDSIHDVWELPAEGLVITMDPSKLKTPALDRQLQMDDTVYLYRRIKEKGATTNV